MQPSRVACFYGQDIVIVRSLGWMHVMYIHVMMCTLAGVSIVSYILCKSVYNVALMFAHNIYVVMGQSDSLINLRILLILTTLGTYTHYYADYNNARMHMEYLVHGSLYQMYLITVIGCQCTSR